jgi:FkbM family methyltransferase
MTDQEPSSGWRNSAKFVNKAGRTMYVLPNDERAAALVEARGDLNPPTLRLWRQLCGRSSWDVVVDVGANYGEMLLSLDLPANAAIVALEPSPEIFACLRQSIETADLEIHLAALAAGSTEGTTKLFVNDRWSGTTTTRSGDDTRARRAVTVDVVRLDTYLARVTTKTNGRLLVKIDVEGSERSVLEGLDTLRTHAIEIVILAEILHISDEDLQWILDRYVVHLADKGSPALLPVVTVSEFRDGIASGRYQFQDAVLATEPLLSLDPSPTVNAAAWRAYSEALQSALVAVRASSRSSLDDAVYEEQLRVTRHFESSSSWRLTRPFRTLRRRLRRSHST